MSSKWYRIDNAGTLFPNVWSKEERNSFRFSAVLYEEVDESLLGVAVKKALVRFPTFAVKLRSGFFWYYLEKNNAEPIIRKDSNIFCHIKPHSDDGYLFSVTYYGKRLSIDIFHALTDGTGGLEFFKSILYYYFELLGGVFDNQGEVLTKEMENYYDEKDDAFNKNYNKLVKQTEKEPNGHKIKDVKFYGKGRFGLFHIIMDLQSLKDVSKKYNVTITQYISACLLNSLYENEFDPNNAEEIFNLFVAVNVRKYFNSKTLRNFALFIRSYSKFHENMTFEEIIEHCKTFFKTELTKEKMEARIVQNVRLERNFFVRTLPLFIKKQAMRIGYKIMSAKVDTINLSNIGKVNCPCGFEKYIDRFEFILGATKTLPMNTSCVSFNNKFVLTISLAMLERNLVKSVVDQLVRDGLDLTIETNDLEVDNDERMS